MFGSGVCVCVSAIRRRETCAPGNLLWGFSCTLLLFPLLETHQRAHGDWFVPLPEYACWLRSRQLVECETCWFNSFLFPISLFHQIYEHTKSCYWWRYFNPKPGNACAFVYWLCVHFTPKTSTSLKATRTGIGQTSVTAFMAPKERIRDLFFKDRERKREGKHKPIELIYYLQLSLSLVKDFAASNSLHLAP